MKRIIKYFIILIIVGISIVLSINFYVILSTKKQITNLSELKNKNDYDCIIVLGAGIWGDKPSPMLQDRLDEAIKLYEEGMGDKHFVYVVSNVRSENRTKISKVSISLLLIK